MMIGVAQVIGMNPTASLVFSSGPPSANASLIKPIQCSREMVRRETPIMIFTALLMWYMAHTGSVITPVEGIIMFVMLIAYTALSYYWSRKESAIAAEIAEKCDEFAAEPEEMPTTGTNVLYIIIGMIGLVAGFIIANLVFLLSWKATPKVNTLFKRLQIITSLGLALSHGNVSGDIPDADYLVRMVAGPGHRLLVPASTLGGATILVGADLIARTIAAPAEIPLGVLTALVGAPFFFWQLRRMRSRQGGWA